MKLLIVDDSKAMRMIVRRALSQTGLKGCDTVEASNGFEALEVINSESPDLILSDWNMPEMKGIELLEKVREAGIETPFGFITSESSNETKTVAKDAGANFVITKPFTPDTLEMALEDVI